MIGLIDLSKHLEFFNPEELNSKAVHIIGLGAIGSTVAELIARLGVEDIHLYDFDKVEPKNVANQMFTHKQIGMAKTDAVKEIILNINPNADVTLHKDGWTGYTMLNGYVFLAVDNIKTRQNIVDQNNFNANIKATFDFRMRLTDAQHYAADWTNTAQVKKLRSSMDFTEEEATNATPVSACGTTLSVAPTIRTIVALGVANWINFVKTKELKTVILIDAFNFLLDAF